MNLKFWKYQGTGNDFVMIDNRGKTLQETLTQSQIGFLCSRRIGIGADGLILLSDSTETDFSMIYYNSDGAESTMCGNGGRCLVAFAYDRGIQKDLYTFDAVDGMHEATYSKDTVHLHMISPHSYRKLNGYSSWIHTGSPHYVGFETDPVTELNVFEKGKKIRYDSRFEAGGGTNVNFVNVLETGHLKVRTYERGVENETLSCGTGVTACAYIYKMEQQPDLENIHIETEGGKLEVHIKQMGDQEIVILSGPAKLVFEGQIELADIT